MPDGEHVLNRESPAIRRAWRARRRSASPSGAEMANYPQFVTSDGPRILGCA